MDLTYVFVSLQPVGRDVHHIALFLTLSDILPFMYVFIFILIRVSHTHSFVFILGCSSNDEHYTMSEHCIAFIF